ncbi:MAG: glycosyltransferase, partial [Planctomycetes bacterium]|nr:glycosyltransferase [Planctomycetota bacterium]
MRAILLHPHDPEVAYASGVGTMINAFVAHAPPEIQIDLLGITGDPQKNPLGDWQDSEVAGKALRWNPIVVDHPSIRSRVPLSFRYTWRLNRVRRRFDLGNASLLFHRLETAWAVHAIEAHKLMFLHYHVQDQILNKKSEVTWGRFPWLYFVLEKRILPRMDHLWSERSDGIAWWKERYPALQGRADWLPTWADDTTYRPYPEASRESHRRDMCASLGLDPKLPVAFFAARFEGQKDPMLLMRSWQQLMSLQPGAQIVLAGAGSVEADMRAFVKTHRLEQQIHFAGTLQQEQVAAWQNAADVFVLSSAFEGMALSMIEALACGTPVVTTRVGEAPRVITKASHGRIVEERTPAAIAQAIHEVLQQP